MRLKVFPIALIAIAAASGAIATGHVEPARGTSRAEVTAQRRGLAFAQKHCSACHAVDQGISPKPEAPSFHVLKPETQGVRETDGGGVFKGVRESNRADATPALFIASS